MTSQREPFSFESWRCLKYVGAIHWAAATEPEEPEEEPEEPEALAARASSIVASDKALESGLSKRFEHASTVDWHSTIIGAIIHSQLA